ncbi:hypothetical protein DP106_13565 [Halonotius pteroides]|uniref:Uncharacterized protein n=1 Tax=Halonotius pteroides TaxID=268735 RepID=A0A3A6QBD9_9EURY|nr:hypothetical protein DP106_13565 [Halonotius pteroides]
MVSGIEFVTLCFAFENLTGFLNCSLSSLRFLFKCSIRAFALNFKKIMRIKIKIRSWIAGY